MSSLKFQAFAAALLACTALPAAAEPLLTVTGHGTVAAGAATLEERITGTADGRGLTIGDALATQHTLMANIAKALARQGVPDRDLAITSLNLTPLFAPGPTILPGPAILPGQARTIIGYTCNTTITVTVENSEKLADILKALGEAGVSQALRVNYVTHDADEAMAQARAAAVKDAFARGQLLAKQTGVTLGPVMAVSDGASLAGLAGYAEQLASVFSASLGANRTVSASVTVSWAIKPQ